jgi:two-component system response regulator LytT
MLVALCDDEKSQLDQLERYLIKYREDDEIKIGRFLSGEQLLEEYKSGVRYDIIFLDIKMAESSGMDVARRLRETDKKAVIIFLTSFIDFALEGYEVHAFRYLVKPLTQERLDTVFTEARREESLRKERYYIINTKDYETVKLSMDDIIYLESFGRNMMVHLDHRDITYTANISKVEEKLRAFDFIRIHKSYIVNLRRIVKISRNSIELSGSTTLPLSRKRQKAVFDEFTRYLANNSI